MDYNSNIFKLILNISWKFFESDDKLTTLTKAVLSVTPLFIYTEIIHKDAEDNVETTCIVAFPDIREIEEYSKNYTEDFTYDVPGSARTDINTSKWVKKLCF